jgi:molybdate transport system substrate-binding protein
MQQRPAAFETDAVQRFALHGAGQRERWTSFFATGASMFERGSALGALLVMSSLVHAAEIRVYSGGAPQAALKLFAKEFEESTGHTPRFTFGVVGDIRARLAAGEQADVVLLPAPMIDAIDKAGALRPGSSVVLARVGIGVVVREGTVRPDISGPDAVRKTLLDARSIAYPDPKVTPSGTHLTRVMVQLGIAEAVRSKTILRNAIDGGVALVGNGDVEIGMFLVSETLPVKGVTLVGLLPSELQSYVVYAGAVAADAVSPGLATAFIKFLADPSKREHWRAAGFEPLGGGK